MTIFGLLYFPRYWNSEISVGYECSSKDSDAVFLFAGIFLNLNFGWYAGLTFMALHLIFQINKINNINKKLSLKIFQSNKIAGFFLVIGSLVNNLNS